jgi:EmrB/QacA subfamily drug resistance transporter
MRSQRETLGLLSGAFLAMTLAALDQAIVTPALPAIARDLHGLGQLSWVVVAYLITSTTMTLVYGKLSDAHGRGMVVLVAIAIFTAASLLCAFAHDMLQLILARALQGVGAGGLLVMAQAMIGDIVPMRERGRYQSYVSIVFAVSTISGPPLGGLLVEIDWRWCFWINLPLGALAFALCRHIAPLLPAGHGARPIDYAGLSLLTATATCFLLVCTWGGTTYAWSSPQIALAFAAAVLLLVLFVWQQRTTSEPIFPARLFAKNVVRLADATSFVMAVLQFAGIILAPVFLQLVLHVEPAQSGLLLVPLMAGTTVGSLASGQIMHRTGRYANVMPIGMTATALGFFLMATMNAGTPAVVAGIYLAAVGIGIGTCYPILNTAVQNAAGPRDIGLATSSVMFSRSLGGAFGAAVFWSLLLGFVASDLSRAAAGDLERGFHDVFLIAGAVGLFGVLVTTQVRDEPLRAATGA